MNFTEYQIQSEATAIYPESAKGIYPVLGLCGEAGEVAEKVKKLIRDRGGKPDSEFILGLEKEIGYVLWYLAAICRDYDLSLGMCAALNLQKLKSRKDRGVLQGSGDNR